MDFSAKHELEKRVRHHERCAQFEEYNGNQSVVRYHLQQATRLRRMVLNIDNQRCQK